MPDREKCRERIKEMLKVNVSIVDIITFSFQEFSLKYEELRKILYEEIQKNEKCN